MRAPFRYTDSLKAFDEEGYDVVLANPRLQGCD
jgi:hypothetical protein